MTPQYTARFQVRSYDVDAWGDLTTRMVAGFFEQTAWEASDAAGFSDAWYREQGTAWVIHHLTLVRCAPIHYLDHLSVDTWISTIGRVRSSREYEMCKGDGTLVAAGQAGWVYVDRARATPQGINREIVQAFEPTPPTPYLGVPFFTDRMDVAGSLFRTAHRARRDEADSMGHINNTVYLAWLGEALDDVLRAAGLPLAPAGGAGLRLRGIWYSADYRRSAKPGDPLEIRSRLTGTAAAGRALEWAQDVVRTSDDEVLFRCTSWQDVDSVSSPPVSAAEILAALVSSA